MTGWGWSRFLPLMRLIRRLRPDAVLLIYIDWIYGCHPMITFAPAALRWILPKARFVTQFENQSGLTGMMPPGGIGKRLAGSLARLLAGRRGLHPVYGSLLRDSAHIIALSEHHAEAFELAHPGVGSKTTVIPPPSLVEPVGPGGLGSPRERGRALFGLAAEDLLLGYFGNIYWMKGLETLLAAFARLSSNVRLLIVGGSADVAYVDRLRELSREAGGADRVIWAGYCENERASLYLHAMDICVLPFNDGIRLNNSSFAAAASHGLPVVTTRGDKLEAPFQDKANVRLCPPKDAASLAATIRDLIHSPEDRKRLGAGARSLAEAHFAWDRVIASTLSALGGRLSSEGRPTSDVSQPGRR